MSRELLQIIKRIDQDNIEIKIALQCAPLLTGIKISNLLIVATGNAQQVFQGFQGTPIAMCVLSRTKHKTVFFLYRKDKLEGYLNSSKVQDLLKYFGYQSLSLNLVLKECSRRYRQYVADEKEFPHELGLLLGYPVEDVIGFIENQGKNPLYTGYWKVYSNVIETKNLFEKYNQAQETVVRMIYSGFGVQNILKIYHGIQYCEVVV
ncbi:MAG: hypothetical protein K0S04_3741 [Herbinix sp.]|jgi:hypothetical protein|nr:hypothetical protein [Herbinix sp.]